jgi:hypothetical protein
MSKLEAAITDLQQAFGGAREVRSRGARRPSLAAEMCGVVVTKGIIGKSLVSRPPLKHVVLRRR